MRNLLDTFYKIPSMQGGFAEYGTQSDWEDMMLDHRIYNRQQWRKALLSLFRKDSADISGFYALHCKFVSFVALLLNRKFKPNSPFQHAEQVTVWDHRGLYAGWECQCLDVQLKVWRYEILSDGDWLM
ncbi:MAG: hypothetical protein ACUZ8H_05330 [Candidatus Anammoxibacter sp.]